MNQKLQAYLTTVEGIIKTTCTALVGGAASALSLKFTDPSAFNFATSAGWHDIEKAAAGGAALALIHLFVPSPKPPQS